MSCILILFGIGLLLGLAASPPLAARNGLDPFHYVIRQAVFGGLAMSVMLVISMMSPRLVRRLGVLGFFVALLRHGAAAGLRHRFRQGRDALVFAGLRLDAALGVSQARVRCPDRLVDGGEPGDRRPAGAAATPSSSWPSSLLLALQPDFGQAALVLFAWGVMYFVAGAPMMLILLLGGLVVLAGTVAYSNSEHFARRIDGFLSPEVDPTTQLGYATNAIREGGFFGVGVGEGQVKWSLPDAHTDFIIAVAAEEYGLVCVLIIIALLRGHRRALAAAG